MNLLFSHMMCTKFYRGSGFLKYGNAFEYRLVVTEPEPGRVLLEEDVSEDVVAKFPVGPLNGGDKYRVTIPNTARTSPGIRGVLEKLFTRGSQDGFTGKN